MFYPTPYFWNSHLQLVPFLIKCYTYRFFPPNNWFEELIICRDGGTVSLNWVLTANCTEEKILEKTESFTPVLVVHHGK